MVVLLIKIVMKTEILVQESVEAASGRGGPESKKPLTILIKGFQVLAA